jgi:hypothetical protein
MATWDLSSLALPGLGATLAPPPPSHRDQKQSFVVPVDVPYAFAVQSAVAMDVPVWKSSPIEWLCGEEVVQASFASQRSLLLTQPCFLIL